MASFWELNRRRKAVLKLAARAEQVNDLSVAIQRQAQQKAQKAKGAAKLPRGSEPGSLSPEQAALIVALDELNQVRNALNVSTNELQGVLKQVRPRVQFLGSNFRFLRSALSGEKRKTFGAEFLQISFVFRVWQVSLAFVVFRKFSSRMVRISGRVSPLCILPVTSFIHIGCRSCSVLGSFSKMLRSQ